ncbi:MAG: acetolactate synthase small subunit [Candidatus Bathyarchaeia archaeon]|nr:acetolactate synthase small subunit [Candidatus Bathyarchaeota archaeon]
MYRSLSTVAFLVENKPGVLFNVTNLFRRRGFNIESISVGPLDDPELARMTITLKADSRVLNQIVEQLDKMVDVIRVKRLDPMRTVAREMLLVKLQTSDPMAREEALKHINSYHGLILDIDAESIIAEVTGETETIEEFLKKVSPIGILEFSRTGVTALEKGRLRL